MKKILLTILIILTLAFSAHAFDFSIGSGEKIANTLIYTVTSVECGITALGVFTDGTNNATVILYDNTAGSGTVIWECTVLGGEHYGGRVWVIPREISTGIYGVVSGTGASFIVEYVLR